MIDLLKLLYYIVYGLIRVCITWAKIANQAIKYVDAKVDSFFKWFDGLK